ncbi:MAG: hypothetical protein QM741_06745 [Rudaea sp.]|uniref:hypothetical protein n=1 Tax=Rudaea sp. TaxID=2136325 RepID=UPI0039E3DD8D
MSADTDKLHASFERIMSVYSTLTAGFTDGERDKLFAANAARIYRLASARHEHEPFDGRFSPP